MVTYEPFEKTSLRIGPRWAWSVALIVAVGAALVAAWMAWDGHAVREWKEGASPLLFFASMAVLPALGAPLTPFYLVAGATFDLGPALLGSALSLTINLTLCYIMARGRMREALSRVMRRFDYELPDFQRKQGALRFALLVKLTPGAPTFLKNYLLGLSGVPFRTYLGVSLLTAAVYAVPLMALGQSLLRHEFSRSAIAALVAAGAALFAWSYWRKSVGR